jgi:DNA-binding MarR family transcriptional regulator
VSEALGPSAVEACRIVEAFTLGARAQHGTAMPPAEFATHLDMILNGLEQGLPEGPAPAGDGAPSQVIQSELWQVLRKMRESAELSYTREIALIELDRRILFLLHNAGPLVPAGISGAVGVDKAQVSRSVKRMLEMGMLERSQIRAPLRLTTKGEGLARRLLRLAELRNRELTFDITDAELGEFHDAVKILLDRAMLLYEQERELAHAAGRAIEPPHARTAAESRPGEKIVIDRTRIISPLMTLSAYFSRSGALAFKRQTGLSTFEAFVLSEICMAPPVDWTTLVAALSRDHSQAGRTVKALMDRGLVEREGKPGRRHGRFFPSATGARLFDVIHQAGRDRSAFLMAPLSDTQRARFFRTFDKLRKNADAQLQRERAFAELDRD